MISNKTQFLKARQQYKKQLETLEMYPDNIRIPAENRFLLIKMYEECCKKESKRLGKAFRKMATLDRLCDQSGLSAVTFRGYLKSYKKGGINSLIPKYGRIKRESPYNFLLPTLRDLVKPDISIMKTFRILSEICGKKNIKMPSSQTIRRLIKRNGLMDQFQKKPEGNIELKPQQKTQKKTKQVKSLDYYKIFEDKWIRIVDKRVFTIAIYKYTLIVPFLNPDIDRVQKKDLIKNVIGRTHYPLPGVAMKISLASLYNYIKILKGKGFEGFIPRHAYRNRYRKNNILEARLEIDIKHPQRSLHQLREILENLPEKHTRKKKKVLAVLDRSIELGGATENPTIINPPLSSKDIDKLNSNLTSPNTIHRNKSVVVLMANDHRSVFDISMATNTPPTTIYYWLKRYRSSGISFIKKKRDQKYLSEEFRMRKDRIVKILHHSPNEYGINRTAWTYKAITSVYKNEFNKSLSITSIRRAIKKTNYTWRRARRVLTSPDPAYKEKTQKVLKTLRNLGANDAFFFIDEAGPWQVKKYGGRSLTEKGTVKIYPQFQKPKGRVSFIGALDAVQNQIIWSFIKSKDTKSVIGLIKVLLYRYKEYSNLFLTWDCASWHKSKDFRKYLKDVNSNSIGPKIEVVPLPKRSQFLNVIESVFSGMKRAIIFNSNYQSEYAMKSAISRHFKERNVFFKENPKRVGNKIWDDQYYDIGNFESGLYRKM